MSNGFSFSFRFSYTRYLNFVSLTDNKPREIVYSMNGNGENLFFDTKDKKFIQKDVAGILLKQ